MNDTQLQSDSELDRILHALAQPEPVPGMAQRILANLTTQPAPRPRRAIFLVPSFATAIIILVLFATHRTSTPKLGQVVSPASATSQSITPLAPKPGRLDSPQGQSQPESEAAVLRARLQPCHTCPSFTAASAAEAIPPLGTMELTAQTNFPAPPQPLTDQEKLLLRLAGRTAPRDVATALGAQAREQQSVRAAVEFETFFAQPIPPPETPNPNLNLNPSPTGDESWQPTGN